MPLRQHHRRRTVLQHIIQQLYGIPSIQQLRMLPKPSVSPAALPPSSKLRSREIPTRTSDPYTSQPPQIICANCSSLTWVSSSWQLNEASSNSTATASGVLATCSSNSSCTPPSPSNTPPSSHSTRTEPSLAPPPRANPNAQWSGLHSLQPILENLYVVPTPSAPSASESKGSRL